jgi:RNA polymerase sigma-70 factor (ECF subfamily)
MTDPAMEQYGPLRRRFATTSWSVVAIASGDAPDTAAQREALARLCAAYWFPLYAFIRWQGHSQNNAEDLVQGFFARLIEKNDLADADPARGRFRTFLLASLRHYMANEHDRQQALKRGGGVRIVSIDVPAAEARLGNAPSQRKTPEREFGRQWALSVLEHALSDLRVEYEGRGRRELFEVLSPLLAGSADEEPSHAEAAQRANLSPGAVKVALHRLRSRYRNAIRRLVQETCADDDEVEAELRHLLDALSSE